MAKVDLKQVKYIGASRLESLNAIGIHTVAQLRAASVEQLAQIPAIGRHYAKLIMAAATAAGRLKTDKTAAAPDAEDRSDDIEAAAIPEIRELKEGLRRILDDLAPPEKENELSLYSDLKKKTAKLCNRLEDAEHIRGGLSKKALKKIIQKADALNAKLEKAGTTFKKKKMRKLTEACRSFSKLLKKSVS